MHVLFNNPRAVTLNHKIALSDRNTLRISGVDESGMDFSLTFHYTSFTLESIENIPLVINNVRKIEATKSKLQLIFYTDTNKRNNATFIFTDRNME